MTVINFSRMRSINRIRTLLSLIRLTLSKHKFKLIFPQLPISIKIFNYSSLHPINHHYQFQLLKIPSIHSIKLFNQTKSLQIHSPFKSPISKIPFQNLVPTIQLIKQPYQHSTKEILNYLRYLKNVMMKKKNSLKIN